MAVTIKDIAQHLNLAKSTVSYALNGGPRPVSPEVKARVLAAAVELGFRRNPVAQSLATRRTRTIGFVPPKLQSDWMYSQYVTQALQSVYATAHARELHVLLPSGYDPHNRSATRQHLSAVPVDGFILVLPPDTDSIQDIETLGVPMVAIGAPPNGLLPTVNADNIEGARLAIQHLLDLGHRNIGHLGSTAAYDTAERFHTFQQFANSGAIQTRANWIVDVSPQYQEGYRAGRELLGLAERPSAIVCVNDLVACGCIRAAFEMGIRIPEELSIIGFDDDAVGQTCLYPLSTVSQPVTEMARIAVEHLQARMDGATVSDTTLPTRLVVRSTTAPPRSLG